MEEPDTTLEESPAGGIEGNADTPESSPDSNNKPSDASREDGKTPDDDGREKMIPRDRFDVVNSSLKTEREKREDAEARLAEYESAKEEEEKNKQDNEWGDDGDEPLTKKELSKREEKLRQDIRREQEMSRINNECKALEKEIDGSDGRPAFNAADVKRHARKNPYDAHPDPKIVYRRMHREELDMWRAKKINEKQKNAHVEKLSESPKEPKKVDTSKMTDKEYDNYVREKYKNK